MSTNKIKVRYTSDIKSIFFKKGEIYEATTPKGSLAGKFYVFCLEDMDEPGDYGVPADRFEIVEE